MEVGQRRRRSGRRGAHPRKSKRRMRRAVAMRQPLAHRGRLAAEMPCVVDALDRPAAVVSFQFPESFQIRPRRPPNQTKTLAGPQLAVKSAAAALPFLRRQRRVPVYRSAKADVFVRCQRRSPLRDPSRYRVPIPDGVAEVMTRAPADAIDKGELWVGLSEDAVERCLDPFF